MWEAKNSDCEEKCFQVFVDYKVQKSAVLNVFCVVQYTFCLSGISARQLVRNSVCDRRKGVRCLNQQ
jgi:hypothetical protein